MTFPKSSYAKNSLMNVLIPTILATTQQSRDSIPIKNTSGQNKKEQISYNVM